MSKFDSIIEALRAEWIAEAEAAYQRGFAAGAEDMRARILNAAQGPVVVPQGDGAPVAPGEAKPAGPVYRPPARVGERAQRGAVGRMLAQILMERPGSTIKEIEDIAPSYDPEVALKSIGNTLRRFDGERYRRDIRGQWFLISDEEAAEKETAGEAPAVLGDPEGGGSDEAP